MSLIIPASGFNAAAHRIAEEVRAGRRRSPLVAGSEPPPPPPPPPPGGTKLPFALMGWTMAEAPEGPGVQSVTPPLYSCTMYTPQPGGVANDLARAKTHGILCLLNLAGSRNNFLIGGNPGTYSEARWRQRIDLFRNIQAIKDAIDDDPPRVMIYLVDEPHIDDFSGTLSAILVNRMGLYVKSLPGWAKALCVVRSGADHMAGSQGAWPNGGPRPPVGGWTGVDYGWSQYSGQHANGGITINQFYNGATGQKARLENANLGCIPSLNWLDGGIIRNTDGVTACWDYLNNGASFGIVHGTTSEFADGTAWGCASVPADPGKVLANPNWVRKWFDVLKDDADYPCSFGWTYPKNNWVEFDPYLTRGNMVNGFRDGMTQFMNRTTFNGFRTPKPPPAP